MGAKWPVAAAPRDVQPPTPTISCPGNFTHPQFFAVCTAVPPSPCSHASPAGEVLSNSPMVPTENPPLEPENQDPKERPVRTMPRCCPNQLYEQFFDTIYMEPAACIHDPLIDHDESTSSGEISPTNSQSNSPRESNFEGDGEFSNSDVASDYLPRVGALREHFVQLSLNNITPGVDVCSKAPPYSEIMGLRKGSSQRSKFGNSPNKLC